MPEPNISRFAPSRFAIYPLLKRVTYWPQAWLGFAMNFGFVTAYVSTANTFNYDILCCALAGCWWYVSLRLSVRGDVAHKRLLVGQCYTVSRLRLNSIIYRILPHSTDTIYACQDIIDDVKTGVLSTAILFGTWIRPMLVGCAMIFIAMLFVAGYLNRQDWGYFVFSVCGTATHLVWQFSTVELDKPESCWSECLVPSSMTCADTSYRKLQAQWPAWLDCMGWPFDRLYIKICHLSLFLVEFIISGMDMFGTASRPDSSQTGSTQQTSLILTLYLCVRYLLIICVIRRLQYE